MNSDQPVSFHSLLTDGYLAIANRGRTFTREGLTAVCQVHVSAKRLKRATPIENESDAEALLKKIRQQRLEAYAPYKDSRSDIEEHVRSEDVLRSEYAGRILLELLQNAHDALAATPIGSKGVGFKSVLNICEGPRIHSGALHCGFDRARSRRLLQAHGLAHEAQRVPLMRLPFPVSPAKEPAPVRKLLASFDTVIVLPFFDATARGRFLKEWEAAVEDATLLLFLPAIDSAAWESESTTRIWRRRQKGTIIEVFEQQASNSVTRWRTWYSKKATVALRLGEADVPLRDEEYPHIRVFFATNERSPLPLLIHADFPLKEGRTNVLIDDAASKAEIDVAIKEVVELVAAALAELRNAGALLDYLPPRVAPEQMEKVEGELWKALIPALARLEVPGTNGIRVGQIRLRPEASWWWFNCKLWNTFKNVLSGHRAGQLSGLPILPPGVDTNERETTILHFNRDARLSAEELRDLTLLPVEGSDQPVSPSKFNVSFPPDGPPPLPPKGIEVRFLDQQFVEAIDRDKEKDNLRKLLIEILGVFEFKPLALVQKAILPVLRTGHQPEGLLDFLCRVVVPSLAKDEIFDWRDPIRRELAERILVPLRSRARLPAAQVYAGTEWTGSDFLERAYAGLSDRGFLHPPPSDGEERERWKKFYGWLGVGWCPKVMPIVCYEDERGTHEGPRWNNGVFPIGYKVDRWPEYCKQFDHFENQPRKARLRQNWMLDGGETVLLLDGAFAVVSDCWSYYSKYQQCVFYRSSSLSVDHDNQKQVGPSHVIWLCQTSRWVSAKDNASKQEPHDVFSRAEIVHQLGGWGCELDVTGDQEFLRAIGIRSGWRELEEADWYRWLKRAADLSKDKINQSPDLKRAVHRLYDAALRHWSGKDDDPRKPPGAWSGPVWRVERNTESWQLASGRDDVFFVDRPDLDELRLPNLWIFPVRLGRLDQAAKERFGLKMLSANLSGQREPAPTTEGLPDQIAQRIASRLPAINAYLEIRENPRCLTSTDAPSIIVVNDLHVRFSLLDRVLSEQQRLDSYYSWNGGKSTLWLDSRLFYENGKPAPSVWECVASALVYGNDLPFDVQPCLKDLLLYESADLERKLLNLGVTRETLDRIVGAPIAVPADGPQPPLQLESSPVNDGGSSTGEGPVPEPPSTQPSGRGDGSGGERRPWGGDRSGGPRQAPADQPGRDAEEWMRSELRKRLEPEGWRISGGPTYDEERRETDIELHHEQFGTFHVEVKHCESDAIYWSEKEVAKAKRNRDRYIMVVLTRSVEKIFEEYWMKNPLEDLMGLRRTGVWEWKGRQEGIELPGNAADWAVPTAKPERPASFSFRVDIGRDLLRRHGLSFEKITARLSLRNESSSMVLK